MAEPRYGPPHYYRREDIRLQLIHRVLTELDTQVSWAMDIGKKLKMNPDKIKNRLMEEAIYIIWDKDQP